MNARIHPVVAFFMAVVAVPLLAQQGNPSTTGPAAASQASQPAASASPASNEAVAAHVVGTIVTVSDDRLELKVEKAAEPSTESAAGLVGQTVAFVLDDKTEKPAELKANDPVDLWFTEDKGQRRAVRIVVAAAASESSKGAAEEQGSSVPPNAGTPANGQPAASPASDEAMPAHVMGTTVTLSDDRLEMKVEKAIAQSPEVTTALVGQTVAFVLDVNTEKPAELKAGDQVDLWFTEDNGQRRAVRVVVAAAASEPSKGATEQQIATVPLNTSPPATGSAAASTSATTSTAPAETAPLEATTQPAKHRATAEKGQPKALVPAAPQPAASTVLPNTTTDAVTIPPSVGANESAATSPGPTGSVGVAEAAGQPQADTSPRNTVRSQSDDPLRFIGLGALAALAALVMLYFTLRARHLDLGIGSASLGLGSGKGGLG